MYISHIFTWFPPHPKLGEFLSRPPPASRILGGWKRERIQAEGSQGTAYFYSWLKNISNFSKFRLFVARRAGPRGEPGPCYLLVGQRQGRSPFPSACAWERRFLQRGREPSRSSGKTNRLRSLAERHPRPTPLTRHLVPPDPWGSRRVDMKGGGGSEVQTGDGGEGSVAL